MGDPSKCPFCLSGVLGRWRNGLGGTGMGIAVWAIRREGSKRAFSKAFYVVGMVS